MHLLLLVVRELGGNFDKRANEQVPRAARRLNPLAAHRERVARLRAFGYGVFERIIEIGHAHLAAQDRRLIRNGQSYVQIHILAFKELVRLDAEHDDKISGGAALRARLPVAAFYDIRISIGSRGNIDGYFRFAARVALSLTIGALVGNALACAVTVGTCPDAHRSAEQRILRIAHLPLSAATTARRERRAVLRTRALARRARLIARITHLARTTLGRIHKRERYLNFNIVARGILLNVTAATEALKNRVEDIAEPAKAAESGAAAHTPHAAHAGVFEFVIVCGALLFIGQNLVGFVDFFELFRRLRIVRVQIGVILLYELFISRLDFVV